MSICTPKKTSTVDSCIEEFDTAIARMINEASYTISSADIEDFKNNIRVMLLSETSPADFFENIGAGAFKECYTALGDWIIKFATINNDTEGEQLILNAAEETKLSELFLPTIFIELPVRLPSTYADADNFDYYYDGTPHSYGCQCGECPSGRRCHCGEDLITAILQPRAITSASHHDEPCCSKEENYKAEPLRYQTGEVVPFSVYREMYVSSHTWLQAVVDTYGDEMFNALHLFTKQYDLSDLHMENTGYLKTPNGERPILLDWLSSYSG